MNHRLLKIFTIATRLEECDFDMRNALSQHNSQITGLMINQAKQIEILVRSTEYFAIVYSELSRMKELRAS